jgi:clan AA aspartic protease (TIGR02281 family)
MRRIVTLALGMVIGQWLAFGPSVSPAEYHVRAQRAWRAEDYLEAMQQWSHAVALQPTDPTAHYLRGTALARLGLRASALDAFQMALRLEPAPVLARRVLDDMARLTAVSGAPARETTVPLEPGAGVWITQVVLNAARPARFLVDTGSSVTVVSPRLAADLGIVAAADSRTVELDTIGGRTGGASAILASLRVGDLELREAPVVLHDPGFDVDGILGNTFLNRYRVTLDADQRQLQLRLLARD